MNECEGCRYGGGFVKEIICPKCNKPMMANIPKKPRGGFWDDSNSNYQNCPHCGAEVCVARESDGNFRVSAYPD